MTSCMPSCRGSSARRGHGRARRRDVAVLPLGSSQNGVPIEALAFTRPPALAAPAATAASGVSAAPLRRPTVVVMAGQHGDEPAGTEALIVVAAGARGGPAVGRARPRRRRAPAARQPRRRRRLHARRRRRHRRQSRSPAAAHAGSARHRQAARTTSRRSSCSTCTNIRSAAPSSPSSARLHRFDALLQYATVANLRAVRHQGGRGVVPPAAARQPARRRPERRLVRDDVEPTRPTARLTMGSVGPQVGRNAERPAQRRQPARRDARRRSRPRRPEAARAVARRRRHERAGERRRAMPTTSSSCASSSTARRRRSPARGEVVIEAAPTPSEYDYAVIDADTGEVRRITVTWNSALQLRTAEEPAAPVRLLAGGRPRATRSSGCACSASRCSSSTSSASCAARATALIAREPIAGTPPRAARRCRCGCKVQTQAALLDVAAGGYYVSLDQPLANLAVAALEPESPSSFAANGVIADVGGEARILLRPAVRMTPVPSRRSDVRSAGARPTGITRSGRASRMDIEATVAPPVVVAARRGGTEHLPASPARCA